MGMFVRHLDKKCKLKAYCDDGTVDYVYGETCDDGNTVSGDGCSSTCKSNSTGPALRRVRRAFTTSYVVTDGLRGQRLAMMETLRPATAVQPAANWRPVTLVPSWAQSANPNAEMA